jgi:fructose-1,6-bisphosphatase II
MSPSTRSTAPPSPPKGKNNALSVIAVSERGSMFDPGPSFYMDKIAVGPDCVGAIDISASIPQNLRWVAKSKQTSVRDLTVCILDRPRHADLIAEVRSSGARIRLITDGDIYGSIAIGVARRRRRRARRHRRHTRSRDHGRRAQEHGWRDAGKLLSPERGRTLRRARCRLRPRSGAHQDDLIQGDNCFFAATGLSDGQLLRGVRFDHMGARTQSLVMRSRSGTVRFIDARHRVRKLQEFSAIDYT